MKRAHSTLLPRVMVAMEALSGATGRSVSSLLNEAATEYLEKRELLPSITAATLQEHMKAKPRPTAARTKRAA